MKVTFRNTFHNTESTVVVKNARLSRWQTEKVKRELCGMNGMKDCHCSQHIEVVSDDNRRLGWMRDINQEPYYEYWVIRYPVSWNDPALNH